jgi:hypothetical protein
MSQVIVTEDRLQKERDLTRKQEHLILKEDLYKRWRISSPNQDRPLFAIAAFAFLPIVAMWFLLLGMIGITMSLFLMLLKGLGKLLGK